MSAIGSTGRVLAAVVCAAAAFATCPGVASAAAPSCVDGQSSTPQNTPLLLPAIGCSDSDPGDTLTYSIVTQPTHGSLTPSGNDQTYTPAAGYTGPDSLTYQASDGTNLSNIATVTITVGGPSNRAPTCPDSTRQATSGHLLTLLPTCTDPDGDPLSYSPVSFPSNGSLGPPAGPGTVGTYTSVPGFVGTDSFTFRATDTSGAQSNVATVTVNVAAASPNHAPVCPGSAVAVALNGSVRLQASCTDADGDTLSYTIVTQPAHGTLTPTGPGTATYTPVANYSGADAFTFRANDGQTDSGDAVVSITVAPAGATVSNAAAGATVSSGSTASATSPAVAELTTPNPGPVVLTASSLPAGSTPPPTGFFFVDQQMQITAPAASSSAPLRITFTIDSSLVPAGQNESTLVVFRDGTAVAACTGASGTAAPDPCVTKRAAAPGGDVAITVLSSHASLWNFGIKVTPSSLCTLTKQFIQGSTRYQALRAPLKAAVDKLGTAACTNLDTVSAKLGPAQRVALVAAYKKAVDALAAPTQGWLTAGQAATLKALADTL
jgi:hypothetical protein